MDPRRTLVLYVLLNILFEAPSVILTYEPPTVVPVPAIAILAPVNLLGFPDPNVFTTLDVIPQ